MALVKCKECSNDISSKATQCPSCGIKVKQKTSLFTWAVTIGVIYAVIALATPELTPEQKAARDQKRATLAAMSADFRASRQTGSSQTTQAPTGIAESQLQESVWIVKGKEAVQSRMKDPDSAEFRNVFFHRGVENTPVTCGEVNGKNSFGAFNGFQRFVSAGSSEMTFMETEVADFSVLWEKMCN